MSHFKQNPLVRESPEDFDRRTAWWREARFGLFLHWGPSSIGGGDTSWSRKSTRPLDIGSDGPGAVEDPGYDNYYRTFNPVRFDAAAWVALARKAGMRYIVLTAKHHDGFAMFHTATSDYTIAQTPFRRDIVRELADACHAADMRFGLYYSPRDWHHPAYGFGDNGAYHNYMKQQVTELLSNYGVIDIIWWDSWGRGDSINYWRAPEFMELVFRLQPQIITNDRCQSFMQRTDTLVGDYTTPEQSIPDRPLPDGQLWETCMTMNDNWGYNPTDRAWKSSAELIRSLCRIAGRGGNFLLNVGPQPDGAFPPEAIERLDALGGWMDANGASIYGSDASPFADLSFEGAATQRNGLTYLHVFDWPRAGVMLPAGLAELPRCRVLATGEPLNAIERTIARPHTLDRAAATIEIPLASHISEETP